MDETDPQIKKLLVKNLKLAEENNSMLRKLLRAMRWGRFLRVLYWLIIIGSAVGAYYIVQPYIEAISNTFGGFGQGVQRVVDVAGKVFDSNVEPPVAP